MSKGINTFRVTKDKLKESGREFHDSFEAMYEKEWRPQEYFL